MTQAVDRKLAAILSADVVAYSRLMAQDEVATVQTLTAYREEMAVLVRQHRGRVVDSPGDNLLAEFPSALDATRCAVQIQQRLNDRNTGLPSDRKMEFRIGIHMGDVMVEGERIYGDGINIASRLERLAHAGDVCISGAVHEQVRHKLELQYQDLGEQRIKNLPDPVRVYRLRLSAEADARASGGAMPGADQLTVPGFSGRPAIAVLPLDNLSGDPEQEYFADGIAEDLITRLSSWRWFPVIARNSSFVYKGKAVDVKQVSQELGVRYVVEGSVRKAGDRVRVSAQLIDATTGHHVWAERYDRKLRDIFALQDEITESIMMAIEPRIRDYERARAIRKDPANLDAWDCAQRGWWHWDRLTRVDNEKARTFLERAIELDPQLVLAFYGLAMTHYFDILYQWTDSPARSIAELVRAAQTSVALDSEDPAGQIALSWAYSLTNQRTKEFAALELAVQLNPSFSMAYLFLGTYLGVVGRPDEGISQLEKSMRLSPQDPLMWASFFGMALAHFAAKRYEEAVDWAQRSLQRKPDWAANYRFLAASFAHLGRIDEARATFDEMLRLQPEYSMAIVQQIFSTADPDFFERYVDGLRKAGWKE